MQKMNLKGTSIEDVLASAPIMLRKPQIGHACKDQNHAPIPRHDGTEMKAWKRVLRFFV
jgi:hypothetical protein